MSHLFLTRAAICSVLTLWACAPSPDPLCATTTRIPSPWNERHSWVQDGLGSHRDVDGTGAVILFSVAMSDHPASIGVGVRPAPGHTRLPASVSWFTLAETTTKGAVDTVGTAFDPSATVAEYETAHLISLPLGALAFNPTSTYQVQFGSESGDDAVPGLVVQSPTCTSP